MSLSDDDDDDALSEMFLDTVKNAYLENMVR
jgi:hypothetical protein